MKLVSIATLSIIGLNAIHLGLLDAAIKGHRIPLIVGLTTAIASPIVKLGTDVIRGSNKNYTLYAGLFGTGLGWAPVYLATRFAQLPGWVLNLSFLGVALFIIWAILPFVTGTRRGRS